MPEITQEDAHELGRLMGKTIVCMFEIMAKVDGTSLQDAIDEWVASYIANRIIEEGTGETDAAG